MEITGKGSVEIEGFKNKSKSYILRNVNNFIDFDNFFEYSLKMVVYKLKEMSQRTSIKFNLHLDSTYLYTHTNSSKMRCFF